MAILTFHNTDSRRQFGLNNYHPKRLRIVLKDLLEAGFQFFTMDKYLSLPADSQKICLAFDDGYESFHKHAFPILRELNLTGVVFIPAGYIGKRADWDYTGNILKTMHLNEAQIASIAEYGIEIGSHGNSHIDLTALSERGLRVELEHSKRRLEDLTGGEVKYISYPFGRFNRNVELWAAKSGYKNGFSLSYFRKSQYGFTVPRYAVYTTDTLFSIVAKIEGGPLGLVEKIKGATLNAYAAGTILINRIRSRNINPQV